MSKPAPAPKPESGVIPGKGTDVSANQPLPDWQAPAASGWWGGRKK